MHVTLILIGSALPFDLGRSSYFTFLSFCDCLASGEGLVGVPSLSVQLSLRRDRQVAPARL